MAGGGVTDLNGPPKWYIPRRFNVIALSFFAITISYMLRSNLSIAILDMSTEFHWKQSNKGLFLSSFFWGYITTQLVGGVAARKFGPKPTQIFVIIVPCILTLFIPWVSKNSEALFVTVRVLCGVAAGGTFPTMYMMLAGWIPHPEKAVSIAIVFAGVNVGTIVIDVVGPVIMKHLGWPFVFYVSGGTGFIWLVLWYVTITSYPNQMRYIHPSEVKYIEDTCEGPVDDGKINVDAKGNEEEQTLLKGKNGLLDNKQALRVLVGYASFWNIVICNFATNWGSYIFLTWLPTYVNEELGFDVQLSGILAITPNISNILFACGSGQLCDVLIVKGFKLLPLRKTLFVIGSLLMIATLTLMAYKEVLGMSNIQVAIMMAIGLGTSGFHLPSLTANIYDIAPYHPSLVVGISNTAGTIPGIVGVFITGVMLQKGMSWGSIWLMAASFYALAMISHFTLCNVKRLV